MWENGLLHACLARYCLHVYLLNIGMCRFFSEIGYNQLENIGPNIVYVLLFGQVLAPHVVCKKKKRI